VCNPSKGHAGSAAGHTPFARVVRTTGMDVIGDLVARERRGDALALRTDSRAGSYSYEKLCTNAWKAGNLLRHYGVRGDATVAIDAGASLSPPPLTAFLGAGLLGAAVRFDPPESVETRALVVPADRVDAYDPGPGTTVLAYGDVPETATANHYGAELWSENPNAPPDGVDPGATLLAGDRPVTQREALSAAERVARETPIEDGDVVAPRGPLSDPGAVVAGVLAPLSVGGTVLLDVSRTGDVGVGADAPEPRTVDPASVF